MAQALGIRLLDARGRDLGPGGAALRDLARIDMRGLDRGVAEAGLVAASDVDNPLVGPRGASAVYGPQKGASPQQVQELDHALRHFAAIVYRDLGIDVRDLPGAGAAGGLGAGLIAFLGAKLRPGVDVVMDAVRFGRRLMETDLVVTGEGSFDEQSMHGKVPAGVLRAAEEHRVPAVVLCGVAKARPEGVRVFSLVERFGTRTSVERARWALEELAQEAARELERERRAAEEAERARTLGGEGR
jgi:glycerate kinase